LFGSSWRHGCSLKYIPYGALLASDLVKNVYSMFLTHPAFDFRHKYLNFTIQNRMCMIFLYSLVRCRMGLTCSIEAHRLFKHHLFNLGYFSSANENRLQSYRHWNTQLRHYVHTVEALCAHIWGTMCTHLRHYVHTFEALCAHIWGTN